MLPVLLGFLCVICSVVAWHLGYAMGDADASRDGPPERPWL